MLKLLQLSFLCEQAWNLTAKIYKQIEHHAHSHVNPQLETTWQYFKPSSVSQAWVIISSYWTVVLVEERINMKSVTLTIGMYRLYRNEHSGMPNQRHNQYQKPAQTLHFCTSDIRKRWAMCTGSADWPADDPFKKRVQLSGVLTKSHQRANRVSGNGRVRIN